MSNKIYTTVPVPKFPRNIFSLSRPVVGSMRLQKNYPTEILEVVPGDAFNVRQETFLRTAPLVAPPLAKVTLNHHAFFVPAWQLHKEFDNFITGGEKMDFTDHLPYTKVEDITDWIYGLLKLLEMSLVDEEAFDTVVNQVSSSQAAYFFSDRFMEDIVSFIEMFDYSRAIPFSMPEFQPLRAQMTDGSIGDLSDLYVGVFTADPDFTTALHDIAEANYNAFKDLNPYIPSVDIRVNLLPFFAYLKVWSEFFRDENLVDDYWDELKDSDLFSAVDYVDLSPNDHFNYAAPDIDDLDEEALDAWLKMVRIFSVKNRPWKKDRFTSALPWTQKGPDVVIPLSGTIPVTVDESTVAGGSSPGYILRVGESKRLNVGTSSASGTFTKLTGSGDLSDAVGLSTMRDLRRAEAVEEFSEADGRFGNRYPENTLGQFGVYTPDSRLPRCQFLGSSSQTISFGEIAQTSETDSTPLGTLAGKGTSYSPGFLFKRRFTMHGFVIIVTSIQVAAMYEQGIHPMFSRFDRTEYAWPRYARLGEEPIYDKELSIFGEHVNESGVFGYAPRYSTYKSDTGSIHGQMKSTLSYWTFSRRFKLGEDPRLNEEFIYNRPRTDAFAVENPYAEQFYFEIDWKVRASRLLPFYGVPSI